MNKILAIAFITLLFACRDTGTDTESIGSPDTVTSSDNTAVAPTTYMPTDGDVTYRDGKVQVMRNGAWDEADKNVTLENGAVVHTDGRIEKDGKEIKMEEGQVVSKEGNFFDKAGNAIENAWGDIKSGVKDAGKEIEKGGKKAEEKADDAVDDNKY